MIQTPEQERDWWNQLDGDEVTHNTAGRPPYNAYLVSQMIQDKLNLRVNALWLLDLGCGVGRLTNYMTRLVRIHPMLDIIGVDIAPSLLNRARRARTPRVEYLLGDGRTLPFVPETGFDGAWSITMFQHIPPDAQLGYVQQVMAALRPGARFVFTVSIGEEEAFLSHQVSLDDVYQWANMTGARLVDTVLDLQGWTWVTMEKREEP